MAHCSLRLGTKFSGPRDSHRNIQFSDVYGSRVDKRELERRGKKRSVAYFCVYAIFMQVSPA